MMLIKRFKILLLLVVVFACNSGKTIISDDWATNVPNSNQVGAARLPETIKKIEAPFPMPQLVKPSFPDFTVDISNHGAVSGTIVTNIIQEEIQEVHEHGGGTVLIPAGKWYTGRIILKSNVNLHLSDGAILYFSGEIEDYRPAVFTRIEGIEVNSLGACIYANGAENIAVTGNGKLIGPANGGSVRKQILTTVVIDEYVPASKPLSERIYEGYNGEPIFPPMFISPINCKNVLIEGISLENTAFWNIVPVYCENVIIRGVTVNSVGIQRGDGIDVESSKNVLIEYCTLSTGDDAFTIKAGRGEDGLRVHKPSENIVVRNCLAFEGHGGITCGSETAGMIRNLYVTDCVFENTRTAIRFKTRRPRGGGGENLFYDNIRIVSAKYAFEWDMLGSQQHVGALAGRNAVTTRNNLTPVYKNISAKNITIENAAQFVKAIALPESPLNKVVLENISAKADKLMEANDVNSFTVSNAVLQTKSASIKLLGSKNILFEKVLFKNPANVVTAEITDGNTGALQFVQCTPDVFQEIKNNKK
ncbi:MAG: glycoside hydrolase family 28 protein [Niabella sp.]